MSAKKVKKKNSILSSDAGKDAEIIKETGSKPAAIKPAVEKKPAANKPEVSKASHSKAKEIVYTIYKTLIGRTSFKVYPGKYIKSKDSTITTTDKDEIAFLEGIREEEKDLPVKLKRILTEDEYYSVKSPEKLIVAYNARTLHISEVREGLDFAVANGWEPEYREIDTVNETTSRVRKGAGGITAGSVTPA